MDYDHFLSNIEQRMRDAEYSNPKPMPIDRWIALSVIQKSIRRNDAYTALRAAVTLWQEDRRAFYTRIILIACEDVGIASPDIVAEVLTIASNATLRRQVGDLKAALYITRILCEAVKVRLADEIFSIVDRGMEYNHLRQAMAKETDKALYEMVLDSQRPLPERCLALWYLAGTKRLPSENLHYREGSLELAIDALRSLKVHPALIESCIRTLKSSRYPLALWTPLLYAAMQSYPRNLMTWTDYYRPTEVHKGIPLAALDMFTRLGKGCYRKLQTIVPELKSFTTQQIGLCLFYTEGFYLDKRLTCIKLNEYRHAGELADIQSAGLTVVRYNELTEIIVSHADTLELIRRKELKTYLQTPREQQGLKI